MRRLLLIAIVATYICVGAGVWFHRTSAASTDWQSGAVFHDSTEQAVSVPSGEDGIAAASQVSDFALIGTVIGLDDAPEPLSQNFGQAVGLDGDYALVGDPGYWAGATACCTGAVFGFVRRDGAWTQHEKLIPGDTTYNFGSAIAVAEGVALVGDPGYENGAIGPGAVYVFERNGDSWLQTQKLVANDGVTGDGFGMSISLDNSTAIISAHGAARVGDPGGYSGVAYVFERINGTWVQRQKLVASDTASVIDFGQAVALSDDTAVIGAVTYPGDGVSIIPTAYFFVRGPSGWRQSQKYMTDNNDSFGISVALEGDTAMIGDPGDMGPDTYQAQGAVYVLNRQGENWIPVQKLTTKDGFILDLFGASVALSGDTALVAVPGQTGSGSVYVFSRTGNYWNQQQKLTGSNTEYNGFGEVALNSFTALVGEPWAIVDGRTNGKAYFFERTPLTLSKSFSPDRVATPGVPPISARINLTTTHGLASATLTDTIPSGLNLVPGTLTSSPPGAALDPTNPKRILWNGVVSPASPVTIQYQVALANGVEPGSVLGSEVVATTSSGNHYSVQASLAVEDNAFSGALMLIYIGADNAVDGFNVGQGDLSDEALRLVNQAELQANTPGVRTIVMLDGPGDKDARIYNLKYDEDLSCPNFQNPYCAGRPIPYVEGENTFSWGDSVANPTSLAEFVIKASLANPKASTILLSLVGHGGGWSPELLKGQPTKHGGQPTKHGGQPTKRGGQPEDAETELAGGLLWDVQPSDGLATADVATALGWVRDATGKKVDLLYLDACLMSMSEVAYELRNGADYLLASESWSWTAFPYDQHIADAGTILASGAPTPAKAIGAAWLGNEVAALSEEDNYPFTVSLTDLSKMPSLVAAQNQLADALIAAFEINDAQTRQRMDEAFAATECVDSDQSGRIEHDAIIGWDDNYCDLGTFATAVMHRFGDNASVVLAAQKVRTALAETVVANEFRSGIPHTYSELPWNWKNLSGLTIYLPLRQDDWKRRYYNDLFLPSSVDSRWGALLTRYWQGVSQPDPTAHPDPICPETGCGMVPAPLPVGSIKVVATPHDSGIQLQWWVSPDASAIVQFDIQRVLLPLTNAPDLVANIPNPVPAPPQPYAYTDTSAERGKEYCYQVIAISSTGGAHAYSHFACATHATPSIPSISAPTVSVTSTGILVEWDAVQTASTAAGYRLYRSTNRGPRLPLADTLFSAGQYLDEAVWQGVEYCYKVHAIGQNGELQAASGEACISLGTQPRFFFLPVINR